MNEETYEHVEALDEFSAILTNRKMPRLQKKKMVSLEKNYGLAILVRGSNRCRRKVNLVTANHDGNQKCMGRINFKGIHLLKIREAITQVTF